MWVGEYQEQAVGSIERSRGDEVSAVKGAGTDHPIPWEEHPVDHVLTTTTTLSDKQKAAILGGNAAHLFGIKEA